MHRYHRQRLVRLCQPPRTPGPGRRHHFPLPRRDRAAGAPDLERTLHPLEVYWAAGGAGRGADAGGRIGGWIWTDLGYVKVLSVRIRTTPWPGAASIATCR